MVTIPPRSLGLMDTLGIKLADPFEIQYEIAERLANAQTPEELFGDAGPLGLREHLDQPFVVTRLQWLPSAKPKGPGFYALISCADVKTGEARTYTSGAMNVLIQLARAAQMNWLEKPVTAVWAGDASPDGNRPYKLVFS
jgi:hypothetical protein